MLLDCIGCLSTPPTGYLLDPAYRGLLSAEERALSDALGEVATRLPRDGAPNWAAQEVEALLRRLGAGTSAATADTAPPDEGTARRDDRRQEQRPG